MPVDNKRIGELDFLKGIAIICVVVGHVHLFSQPPGGAEDWTYRVICWESDDSYI